MATKEFNYSGFTRVNVRFAMEVEIVRADTFSISVSGSDTLLDNLYASLEGDRLILGYNLNLVSFFAAPFSKAHVRITMPELKELNISGAARGTMRGFNSPNDFTLLVTGASHMEISEMSVGAMRWELSGASRISGQVKVTGNLDLRITGASRIDLKGSAQGMELDATGASQLDLYDFPVGNARVKLSGASRSIVNLNGKLDVDLSGASNLEYSGQVNMGEVRVTGASTLKKR